MNLKGSVLSEISQTQNDKYHMISLICVESKNKTRLIVTESRMVVTRGWGG